MWALQLFRTRTGVDVYLAYEMLPDEVYAPGVVIAAHERRCTEEVAFRT